MRTRCSRAALALGGTLLAALPAVFAAAPPAPPAARFDSQPWLEDLAQIRTAVATRYANLAWQVSERGVDLSDLFARAQRRRRTCRRALAPDAGRCCWRGHAHCVRAARV